MNSGDCFSINPEMGLKVFNSPLFEPYFMMFFPIETAFSSVRSHANWISCNKLWFYLGNVRLYSDGGKEVKKRILKKKEINFFFGFFFENRETVGNSLNQCLKLNHDIEGHKLWGSPVSKSGEDRRGPEIIYCSHKLTPLT